MSRGFPSRRDVLRALGAVAAASPLAVAQPPRRYRWAAGWLLWRDFAPRRIPLAEALRDLREVGCDGIEFTPRPGELAAAGLTLDAARGLLKDHGLQVSAHYLSVASHDPARREEVLAEAQAKIDSLRAFGATHLVIGPPSVSEGIDRREAIARVAPLLTEVGRRARDQGVTAGIHPHLNTLVETPDETDLVLDRCDPAYVGLALDTGHFHLAGGDVAGAVKRHGPRLSYLHFKDAVRPFVRPDFFPSLRELGRGQIDFPATMRALAGVGYTGWINVEQDFTPTTPLDSIRTSMRYVRETLDRR